MQTAIDTSPTTQTDSHPGLLVASGILLGMGAAGFFDGIVLHEILQWHHMLTSVKPLTSMSNIELNTLWDGIFHVLCVALTVAGLVLLWRASKRADVPKSPNLLFSTMIIGAGAFNIVEGLIDHHLLGIHHVKSGAYQTYWDLGFLAISAVLVIVGSVWFSRERSRV